MSDPSVAVVGGGIGGATAMLSLLRAGVDAHLYEQSTELREVGAGIQLSPNATRVLHELGFATDLARVAVRSQAVNQRRWDDGRTLQRTPLADAVEAEFGAPHYQIHRADLLAMLMSAIPADRVHLGHRLTAIEQGADEVRAQFADGTRIVVDCLVGADGIHSNLRAELFGADAPRFTGCVCYRGLIPAERVAHLDIPREVQVWMGPDKHVVHYYVQGGALLNFVAVVEQDSWTGESWTDKGDIADALAAFDGWHPQVCSILGAVDETFIWALFDRHPLPQWSQGRCTLLGDACHPMLPFVAQGAAQAIEDGATLAAILRDIQRDGVPSALKQYEHLRLPRTAQVQGQAMGNKTRFHLADGPDQIARDLKMAQDEAGFSARAMAWLYAHDATRPDRT